MKRVFASVGLFAALCGCLPVSTYYREGASLPALERDRTNCEVAALRDAPVAQITKQAPPRYVPGQRICDASGACRVAPGYYVPGALYTVDVNADLRARVTDQCMSARGYAPVTIPACPPGVAKAAPPGSTNRLPKLRPKSCAIRTPEGRFRIVNRG